MCSMTFAILIWLTDSALHTVRVQNDVTLIAWRLDVSSLMTQDQPHVRYERSQLTPNQNDKF